MKRENLKKIIGLLAVLTLFFELNMESVQAKKSINLHPYYSEYVTCTVNKKPGVNVLVNVYFTNPAGRNNYVKLTDGAGRFVWEGSIGTYNKLWLGADHKSYRIYVRSNGGPKNTGTVNFSVVSGSGSIR